MNRLAAVITICAGIYCMVMLAGCAASSPYTQTSISNAISERTGMDLRSAGVADTSKLPSTVNLADGLSEEEAVAIALWNNSQFQVDLAELGFVRADLLEAGLLRNPTFSLLFPIGPKQLEYALSLPLEFLWQRPFRISVAQVNAEKVAENLVHHGLQLVREVRIAYSDLAAANEKYKCVTGEAQVARETALIASARLRVGDISGLEENAFRLAAAQTEDRLLQYLREQQRGELHLSLLLGFCVDTMNVKLQSVGMPTNSIPGKDSLLVLAFAARPDLRAAELEIEAAGKKAGWEISKIFNLTAVLDAKKEGEEGIIIGPGLDVEIPLFNWNGAERTRAQAELELAAKLYLVSKQKIIAEVLQCYYDHLAAQRTWKLLEEEIIPLVLSTEKKAEQAYKVGEASYFEYLEFKRQLIEARVREAEAKAEVKRSVANLQFAVGCRFDTPVSRSDSQPKKSIDH
ncbi:MAG: TolC family protein [bacterium]